MKLWKAVLFALASSVMSSALASRGVMAVQAQEKDPTYPPTRSWVLGVYDRYKDFPNYKTRVGVIDTAGVCLYLLQADAPTWEATTTQLLAVPKTQLPKGAGCQ